MNIAVIGTGYVGLVTGVCLAEIGHHVACIDVDEKKIELMKLGTSPFYEPQLEEYMKKNMQRNRLEFTNDHLQGLKNKNVIFIAVGTTENEDGTANIEHVEAAAKRIAADVTNDVIVVIKSTVPVGTNEHIKRIIINNLASPVHVDIVSNPEFLREGSAINDTFFADRIIIGAENDFAAKVVEDINGPFGVPVVKTHLRSAEMIKYASNAFLATKISFINEIAGICEKLDTNVEDVARGMGKDERIGNRYLHPGIGYGGSCFPKDTKALIQMAGNVHHNFELLKSVIKVNQKQQTILIDKAERHFGHLKGRHIAILGFSFKPGTDDMREAPSILITKKLKEKGATIAAYDPAASENAKSILPAFVRYEPTIEKALEKADAVFILTEWEEIKSFNFGKAHQFMKNPVIFDGRNCFNLDEIKQSGVEYHSIGRPSVNSGQ